MEWPSYLGAGLVGMVAQRRDGGGQHRDGGERGGPPPRYHRRKTDPDYDPEAPVGRPHLREADLSWKAKLKEWSGVLAAGALILTFGGTVLRALGGQFLTPGDRQETDRERILKLEAGQRQIMDSVTRMLNPVVANTRALTLYRCMNASAQEIIYLGLRDQCQVLTGNAHPELMERFNQRLQTNAPAEAGR